SVPAEPAAAGPRLRARLFPLPPAAVCLLLAAGVVAAVVAFGLATSTDYHTFAHYHFDSAAYRYSSYLNFVSYTQKGRWATAWSLLQQKDTLDLVLRAVVKPV